MRKTRHLAEIAGSIMSAALFGALGGCVISPEPTGYGYGTTYGGAADVDGSYVVVQDDSDFYEPLSPYGQWEVIGSYGQCWVPGRIEADWRPYCDGQWVYTDAGWYWESTEPWAWATYHYGCWDFDVHLGWFWIPDTRWGPAWVSWHEGDGYIGWAPLGPGARRSRGGFTRDDTPNVSPRGYVFVDQRRFLDRVRPTTVVRNSTTIINRTTNITNIHVVNQTVINEGPPTAVIERASGRRVQPVAARSVRRQDENAAFAGKPFRRPGNGQNAAPAAHREIANPANHTRTAPEPRPIQNGAHGPVSPTVAPPSATVPHRAPTEREISPPVVEHPKTRREEEPPPPAAVVPHREPPTREVSPPTVEHPKPKREEEQPAHVEPPPPVGAESHRTIPAPAQAAPVQEPRIHSGPVKAVPPNAVAPKENKNAGKSGEKGEPEDQRKKGELLR